MTLRRPRALMLLALFGACTHGREMVVVDHGDTATYTPGLPARLTWNAGPDQDPSWLPDGSGILYTAVDFSRDDDDACLAVLPPTGGRIRYLRCENGFAAGDSTNTFTSGMAGPGGRVAFVRSSYFGADQRFAKSIDLVVGDLDAPARALPVASIPYTMPGGLTHNSVSQIRWLGPHAVVYRGDWFGYLCLVEFQQCPLIPVNTGRQLVYQPLTPLAGQRRLLPGTEFASSVAAGDDPDELFFTRGGDTRVYRYVVSTGVTTTVVDFGTIVRDVHYANGRLTAVAGGQVQYEHRPSLEYIQFDLGGDLVYYEFGSTAFGTLAFGSYRHPAIAPDGGHIVAESQGDLWLFELP